MLTLSAQKIDAPEPPVFDTKTPTSKVRRVILADIAEIGQWLVTRCKEIYPRTSERMLWAWINSCLNDRFCYMIRSDKAVGMVRLLREPMETDMIADEMFLFAMDGGMDDAASLYPAFRKWCEVSRVAEWRLGQHSDLPMSVIKEIVGGKRTRTIHYVDFQK